MGGGIGAIESALRELFEKADNEVALTAYSISNSSDRIFEFVSGALARGVRVTMVVNRANAQPPSVLKMIKRLVAQYPHFTARDYESSDPNADLHAKAIVIDRKVAMVGSSNLSQRGWVKNHELAVVIRGNAAREVAKAIDRLVADRACSPISAGS